MCAIPARVSVRLEPWGKDDLPLLRRIMGDPAMTEHLGGPEIEEKLADRQAWYEREGEPGSGQILDESTSEPAGSVGYWKKDWRGGTVYETGWSVLPGFQGRGIAAEATRRVIEAARAERRHRYLHAFPSVENAPSNAICRKFDFELLEECDFEYPPGNRLRCNDWRLDLLSAD
jgi:RimJ/RimL family protein N-acetyltransferase